MKIKNLKVLVVLFVFSLITLSCSDDNQSTNLLFDHVWNYGEVTSTQSQGGFNFNLTGQYQGTLVFNSNGSYTSNVTGGVIIMSSDFPGSSPITQPVPATLDTGTYVYLEGPNKIRGVSDLSPDEEVEYYILEITSNKLVLKIDLSENGVNQEGEYILHLTR